MERKFEGSSKKLFQGSVNFSKEAARLYESLFSLNKASWTDKTSLG